MTLFHITAGEPWPEEPPLFDEDGTVDWEVCSFHMAYEITVNWVILQARNPNDHIYVIGTKQDDLHHYFDSFELNTSARRR